MSVVPVKHEPKILVIDGAIGAGKTTLCQLLIQELIKRGYTVGLIDEPVEEWKKIGILQAFYENQERYAYEFQTYTYVTRVEECIRGYEKYKSCDIILMERSIFADRHIFVEMLHESGEIDEMHYAMYTRWWQMWRRVIPFDITGIIYMRQDIDVCMSRIAKRARPSETKITVEYMTKLKNYYDEYYMNKISGVPTMITTGGDYLSDTCLISDTTDDILKYLFG